MNDSLSIIVPVRNAEATLAAQLARLLDVIPDLTGRFEIVVVDDASADQTVELVRDLASQYPQLRLIRHREARGAEAAVRTGLEWAQGGTVFVQENPASLSPTDLRRLWSMRHDEQLVMARAPARPRAFDQQVLQRLSEWGQALKALSPDDHDQGGIQMIRSAVGRELSAEENIGYGIEIAEPPERTQSRTDPSHRPLLPRRARSFLIHLKNLALGE